LHIEKALVHRAASSLGIAVQVHQKGNGLMKSDAIFRHFMAFCLCAGLFSTSPLFSQDWPDILSNVRSLTTEATRDSTIRFGEHLTIQAFSEYARDDSSLSDALCNVGQFCYETLQYVKAESLFHRSLLLRNRRTREMDSVGAVILQRIGDTEQKLGYYWKAEETHRRCLRERERLFGTTHVDVARTLARLSHDYLLQVDFGKAEREGVQAETLLDSLFGPKDPELRYIHFVLGSNYAYSNVWRKAIEHLEKARVLYEAIEGPNCPGSLLAMNIKAYVLWTQGKRTDAITFLQESVKHWGSSLHLGASHAIRDLGELNRRLGNYPEAIPLLQEAKRRWGIVLGETHPYTGDVSLSLGEAYLEVGDLARAESMLSRCLSIRETHFGKENTQVAACLEPYSSYCRLSGRSALAFDQSFRALNIRRRDLDLKCLIMDEKSAWQTSTETRRSRDLCLSAFKDIRNPGESIVRMVAGIVLSTKGLVSEAAMIRAQDIERRFDVDSDLTVQRYNDLRKQIATEYVKGPRGQHLVTFNHRMDSLVAMSDRLEAELAQRSAQFRRAQAYRNVDVANIVPLLPRRSALIEYLRYQYQRVGLPPEDRYLATLIDDEGKVKVADIGRAEELDSITDQYRRHLLAIALRQKTISWEDQTAYSKLARSLYDRLVAPLGKRIMPYETLLFAPDAGLNAISFAALQDRSSKYLVEKHQVHYLSAGRDLVRMDPVANTKTGLIAFGDPDFDASVGDRAVALQDTSGKKLLAQQFSHSVEVHNLRSSSKALSQIHLGPLQNSNAEVTNAVSLYQKYRNGDLAFLCTGAKASEEVFRNRAGLFRMIHIASHGYYLMGYSATQEEAAENPLLLSGFFLAGANLHGRGSDIKGAEDGVVTALEVSIMDLCGTDLVILSACETALGEVKNGEGVYGLRRAFQMAGARTIISALWQVPDNETSLFMKVLYSNKTMTYPELLQKTTLARLEELRRRGRPSHPFSWGAFIATGDWRSKQVSHE
jgi:CHAT domain-containing protein